MGRDLDDLVGAPGIPATWLVEGSARRLKSIADREAERQRARSDISTRLKDAFGPPVPRWDYRALAQAFHLDAVEQHVLKELYGDAWSTDLLGQNGNQSNAIEELRIAVGQLESDTIAVADWLGVATGDTWEQIVAQLGLTEGIARLGPVPDDWLYDRGKRLVVETCERARQLAEELSEAEMGLSAEFEDAVLEAVDQEMLVRYRTDHQGRLRRFVSSMYRSDRRTLLGFRRRLGKMSIDEELGAVERIVEVKRRQAEWDTIAAELAGCGRIGSDGAIG